MNKIEKEILKKSDYVCIEIPNHQYCLFGRILSKKAVKDAVLSALIFTRMLMVVPRNITPAVVVLNTKMINKITTYIQNGGNI